jgi:benzoylformate decarboxylase
VTLAENPDTERMSGALAVDVLLECLEELGIRYVFGNPGTTEQVFIAALARRPTPAYVLGLHETVAVAMADGYSRATRKPSFVNLHISAGVANGLSQIQNASYGQSPIVVTAGQSDSRLLVQEPLLSADLCGMAKPFTKWTWELRHGSDLPLALRRAFSIAMQPPRGPVFLSLPQDLLEESIPSSPKSEGVTFQRTHAEPEGIGSAADLLLKARRPTILCGDGVARAEAVGELVGLAETLGAQVFAVSQSEVSFPNDHPLFVRTINVNSAATRAILSGADAYLAVGTPLFSQFLYLGEPLISPDTPVVHLEETPREIAKNAPVAVGISGDLPHLCSALAAELRLTMSADDLARAMERRAESEQRKHQAQLRLVERLNATDGDEISNLRLMRALREVVPHDAIFVEEAPTAAGALQQVFQFSQPDSFFSARGGALGWGAPGALGVQLACSDRVVVALLGDGAALYGIQALWTAAHYRLPVKFVIANNRGYGILKANLAAHFGDTNAPRSFLGMDIRDPELNFAFVAEGFGVPAQRVTDAGILESAVQHALSFPGPFLLDVALTERQ